MRLRPVGERGLLAELDDLAAVHALTAAVRSAAPEGVVDVVPGYRTVLVTVRAADDLEPLRRLLPQLPLERPEGTGGRLVELPVVYDGEDLDDVCRLTGLSRAEVVARHTGRDHLVAFLGFAPGFPYLVGLDPALRVPRRATPRTRVPAGAVGLAGDQTGVYPRSTPGGWQVIGHTDVQLFDATRRPPALLAPGDRLRFVDVG